MQRCPLLAPGARVRVPCSAPFAIAYKVLVHYLDGMLLHCERLLALRQHNGGEAAVANAAKDAEV